MRLDVLTNNSPSNLKIWRKKPQQSRSINKANIILEAAVKIFFEKGFHNTKSDDIAHEAGVGVASIYDFFPNKTAIALALLEKATFEIIEDSRKIFKANSAAEVQFNESMPQVVRGIFYDYKRHKSILIDLVAEVPELRSTDIYSIDRLIQQSSLIYMQHFLDEFVVDDLRKAHSFVHLLFIASLKEYLTQAPEELSEEEFLNQICETILIFLTHK